MPWMPGRPEVHPVRALPATSAEAPTTRARTWSTSRFSGAPPTRRVVLAWRRSFTRYEAIAALRNAVYACALPGVTRLS